MRRTIALITEGTVLIGVGVCLAFGDLRNTALTVVLTLLAAFSLAIFIGTLRGTEKHGNSRTPRASIEQPETKLTDR